MAFWENLTYQENELAQMHEKLGHEVTIITSEKLSSSSYIDASWIKNLKNSPEKDKPAGYRIIRLPVKYKINFRFWRLKYLYETLSEIKPDLIFFHGITSFSLLDAAEYKRKNPSVKLVVDSHSDHYNSGRGFLSKEIFHKCIYRNTIRKTSKEIDIYYYLSPNIKNFMQEMYLLDDSKLKYLPRGGVVENLNIENADAIRYMIREQLDIPQNAIVLVSGGKLDYKKKTHNLLEAVNRLNNPDVYLIVFGSIDSKYQKIIEPYVKKHSNIRLIGWIHSKDVHKYFFASDIACFPGRHSVLWEEAICCGLPLIVKDWYNGMYYLNVKNNVILIKDSDTLYIEEALRKLIDDPLLLNVMKVNAQTFGREFFSYRRIAQSIIDDVSL